MQIVAFSDLLEKYQDFDMSPGAEEFNKVLARFEQPWTTYFFIVSDELRRFTDLIIGAWILFCRRKGMFIFMRRWDITVQARLKT